MASMSPVGSWELSVSNAFPSQCLWERQSLDPGIFQIIALIGFPLKTGAHPPTCPPLSSGVGCADENRIALSTKYQW